MCFSLQTAREREYTKDFFSLNGNNEKTYGTISCLEKIVKDTSSKDKEHEKITADATTKAAKGKSKFFFFLI